MTWFRYLFVSFVLLSTLAGCTHTRSLDAPAAATDASSEATVEASTPETSTAETSTAEAPSEPAQDWYLHDAEGPFRGTSVTQAYRTLLADKQPRKRVVVAVMDSGVDIHHEDFQSNIWTNEDEVPDNGKDDDGNGYIDDVHGWNFVVDAEGKTVAVDTYEVTRALARLRARYADVDPATLSGAARDEYAYYLEVKDAYEQRQVQMTQTFAQAQGMLAGFLQADSLLKAHLGTDALASAQVAALETEDEGLQQAKETWLNLTGHGLTPAQLQGQVDGLSARMDVAFDLDANPRAGVYEAEPRYYGNNDLYGPDPFHGTHVTGLIAAVRGNGIGLDGIADYVQVMPIRTTPQGDERDRDIANGIRYAVDNGADIINMSFGKSHSGDKSLVDEAVRYAAAHGVLLVHGSGNDGNDLDSTDFFPQPYFLDGTDAPNWIEVGATSWRTGERFAAFFSNYGAQTVDLFAPGRRIYSSQPENHYAYFDGTSLSAPIVSGIAALVMSYYPELSMEQVRDVLLHSVTSYAGQQVRRPDMDQSVHTLVDFGTLSSTGGVVNAYAALQHAAELANR